MNIYELENRINRDINICFLAGKIISEPEFKFFYNDKRYVSKVSFVVQTETGFQSSKKQKSQIIKIIAYNEKADLVYRNFHLHDKIRMQGFLGEDGVVLSKI